VLSEINFFLVLMQRSSRAEVKTWGSCHGAVSVRSASKRGIAIRLSYATACCFGRASTCGSPSAVQRGEQAAWAELAERLNSDQSPTTAARHPLTRMCIQQFLRVDGENVKTRTC
jgi:hypothetical protein